MKDPVFSKDDAYVLDHKHGYERACQKGLRIMEIVKKNNITKEDEIHILERYTDFCNTHKCSFLC